MGTVCLQFSSAAVVWLFVTHERSTLRCLCSSPQFRLTPIGAVIQLSSVVARSSVPSTESFCRKSVTAMRWPKWSLASFLQHFPFRMDRLNFCSSKGLKSFPIPQSKASIFGRQAFFHCPTPHMGHRKNIPWLDNLSRAAARAI